MPEPEITVSAESLGRRIVITTTHPSSFIWAELKVAITSSASDAEAIGSQLTVSATGFREALLSFGRVIQRYAAQVHYEPPVLSLIETQSRELASRRAAQTIPTPADESEVLSVLKSACFMRSLTLQQIRDVRILLGLAHGANFSVPGAGKTTSLLAVHIYECQKHPDLRLLVVAPKNAFISWDEELRACIGDEVHLTRLTGGRQQVSALLLNNPRYAMITYEQLRNSSETVRAFLGRNTVHLVLDEAHRIKGGEMGATASAILTLAADAYRRDILTGTPMPQSLRDLEPQFDFLWVGQHLMRPILSRGDNDDAKTTAATEAVRPLYVRTTKQEMELPPVTMREIRVKLQPVQQELYNLIRSNAARASRGMDKTSYEFFRGLRRRVVRLLQAASNPALLAGDLADSLDMREWLLSVNPEELRVLLTDFHTNEEPAKLAAGERLTRRIVCKLGRKTLIWSSFVNNIRYLEGRLSDLGAVTIFGGTPAGDECDLATREGRINRFRNSDECRVMIANPAACGEGISLHTVCHDAIYVDRSFNAAHFMQSVDRIHRLGLPKDQETNIYVVTAEGTIDTVVRDRLALKIERMSHVLEDTSLAALAYDPEDIEDSTPDGLDADDVAHILAHITS